MRSILSIILLLVIIGLVVCRIEGQSTNLDADDALDRMGANGRRLGEAARLDGIAGRAARRPSAGRRGRPGARLFVRIGGFSRCDLNQAVRQIGLLRAYSDARRLSTTGWQGTAYENLSGPSPDLCTDRDRRRPLLDYER